LAKPNPKDLPALKKAPKVTSIAQSCYGQKSELGLAHGRRKGLSEASKSVRDR
jgi:hypothetical protein